MRRVSPFHRWYRKLALAERVRLALAAYERGDAGEVYGLINTCRPADLRDYGNSLFALGFTASVVVVRLLASEVLTVKLYEDLADQPGANPALERKLVSLLERRAAMWSGFAEWCRGHGHNPRRVLHMAPLGLNERDPAFFIVQNTIDYIESQAQDPHGPVPDPEQVREWRDMFDNLFPSSFLDGEPVDDERFK